MPIPGFIHNGDLPIGIHKATLQETIDRFGVSTDARRLVAARLSRIYQVALETGHLAHFIIFGSFVTSKLQPNDVDVFMIMENSFDSTALNGETEMLFDNNFADSYFGASVFWLRRLSALGGEKETLEYRQIKRGGGHRGIIEIVGV